MAVMALLIAQIGALSHAYSHDGYAHAARAQGLGHNAFTQDAFAGAASIHSISAGSHDPCGDCLAYAPLLSAAGATTSLPFALPQVRGAAARGTARSLNDRSPLLAFRSRAPPSTP
jgi:methyl coenzyme M reductase alpha subunit